MSKIEVIIKGSNDTVKVIANSAEDIFEIFCDLNHNVLDAGCTLNREYFLLYDKSIIETEEYREMIDYYHITPCQL